MGSNTSKPLDAQNNDPASSHAQSPQRRRTKLGSIRQPKNKISKGNLGRREPTILSPDTLPLPASCTRPSVQSAKSTPLTGATIQRSAEQNTVASNTTTTSTHPINSKLTSSTTPPSGPDGFANHNNHNDHTVGLDSNNLNSHNLNNPNHPSSLPNARISLVSQSSYVGMTQSREPRQRVPRGRNPQNRYSQRVYSNISCATSDSGQSSWMLSGGLFSQIDSTTSSIITTITDYSNISRRSMFAQDWPKEDTSKMVISASETTPASPIKPLSNLQESALISVQPEQTNNNPKSSPSLSLSSSSLSLSLLISSQAQTLTLSLLDQLNNSPHQEFSILKAAFAKSQQTGYAHHQEEAFRAAFAWSQRTNSLTGRVWVARCQIEGWGTSADPSHGFSTLKAIAETDDYWEAFYPLAMCYLNGVSAVRNHQELSSSSSSPPPPPPPITTAAVVAKSSSSSSSPSSSPSLALSANVITHNEPYSVQPIDNQTAFRWLKATAEIDYASKGTDPEIRSIVAKAQYRVAVMLFKGAEKMAQDPVGALQWFIKSADNGDKYAQYITGLHYERGMFTEKDTLKARSYLLQSANQDFGDAQAALGIACIEEGQDKEGMQALLKLGLMYETGQGVEKNDAIAVSYYKSAANRDDARAQYVLGLAYYMGNLGLQKNFGRAEKYFTLSAKAGYAPSQRILGLMCAQDLLGFSSDLSESNNTNDNNNNSAGGGGGGGGAAAVSRRKDRERDKDKDIKAALTWFRRAAYQGDIRALGLVGFCYENGHGVAANFETALEYYRKAARITGPFQDSAQLALAHLLHRMERHRDALNWFNRAAASWSAEQPPIGSAESAKSDPLQLLMEHRVASRTAALMVARYQLHGWTGASKRPKAAFDILFHLARQSELDSHAHYWLAACYEEGVQGRCEKDLSKAFEHYLVSAKAGDVDGEFQVALMLSNGQGVEQDRAAAFYWYEKAAKKEHKTALYSLGLYYAKGMAGVTKDLFKARSCFKRSARLGVVSAMTTLATLYKMTASRIDPSQDPDETETQSQSQSQFLEEQQRQAVYWFEKAAQYGDAVAQRELAILYDAGIGVNQSYAKALSYLQKSASQRDTQATLLLGNYYQNGHAVEKDLSQAIELYLEAADLGSPVAPFAAAQVYHALKQYEEAYAQYKIAANDPRLANARVSKASKLMVARYALSYVPLLSSADSTEVVSQDVEKMSKKDAFQMLYNLATEDQFESSYFWLADCFYMGNGVAINYPQALMWYNRSVEATRDAEAMAKIGSIYEQGLGGVEKNERLAIDYYKQSADQGSAEGQYKMGLANWRGMCGVPINLGDAVLWFTWSAKQKYPDSHWALGQMALENGDQDVATEWWHKAIALDHIPSMRSLASLLLQTSNQTQPQTQAQAQTQTQSQTGVVTPNSHLEHAMELLANAFRHGDAESLVDLGKLHQRGIVTQADSNSSNNSGHPTVLLLQPGFLTPKQQEEQELATRCFEEAAAMGHVESMFLAAESWHARQQYAAALGFYEKAAHKGHISSRAMVAHYRLKGLGGIEADPSSAYKDLLYCAEKESSSAVFNLIGQCNEHGLGTPKNYQEALEWYLRSSRKTRDPEAMFRVGQLVARRQAAIQRDEEDHLISSSLPSTGLNPDLQALEWYQLSIDTSDHGQSHLGAGLYFSQGIKDKKTGKILLAPDVNLAIEHFRKAASQCIPEAMFELGQFFLLTTGARPSPRETTVMANEGVKWLERAAQLGLRGAQRELGKLYHSGHTVMTYPQVQENENEDEELEAIDVVNREPNLPVVVVAQDFAKAFDYFCRAAQQKDKTASLFLGIYHENGIYVQTNTELAKEWYRIAVVLGKQQEQKSRGSREDGGEDGWWLAELALAQLLHQEPVNRHEAYPLFEAAYCHAPLHQKRTALIMVARYRLHGWGNVAVNLEEGASMLVRLANEGEVKVFLEVAQCYEFGIGVEQDFQKAFEWYQRLVVGLDNMKNDDDEGDSDQVSACLDEEDVEDQAEASFRLAEFYKSGLVVSTDLQKANHYYRVAANKGSLKAKESLKQKL
ncbi:hypothetical protein F4703DRAFT_1939273 [Phycomyces blakesleeanus]